MSDVLELRFVPGLAMDFIEKLWRHLPAVPDGVFLGAVHLIGDRGQMVLSMRHEQVKQLVVQPGQVLTVADPVDPSTWHVIDGPAHLHLRLPT